MATPSNAMLNRLQTILAQDTGSLAAATALKVHLAQNAFVPSPSLALASLTEATFVGGAALNATIGNAITYNDPVTGNRQIELSPPAGGWHWQATAVTSLPQIIYGWYLTDNGVATLWASALLAAPITITNIGDGLDVARVNFAMPAGALF